MKLFRTFSLFVLLAASSSCALMMNDKNDQVAINSSPAGADIFIDGKHHGQTPANLNIEAKNSTVVITKEGYGSTQLQLEAWATMKNGACSADAMTAILPWSLYSAFWSGRCNEFKEKEYFVTIPRTGVSPTRNSNIGGGYGQQGQGRGGYQQQYPGQYRR
jgi:hypothetical protein